MLRIKAFQGLRPVPALVSQVACVPYDVVDRNESAALAQGNPRSLLHVDRAEIDLPENVDPYSPQVYAKALENFQRLQTDGSLVRETAPCIYLYQQRMGNHTQTGVALVCHIEDYENDIIKKHEKTRRDKEDDRTRLIDTISADTGPVFLTYRDSAEINTLVTRAQSGAPFFDFTAPDGIQHTVWRLEGGADIVMAITAQPALCAWDASAGRKTRITPATKTTTGFSLYYSPQASCRFSHTTVLCMI